MKPKMLLVLLLLVLPAGLRADPAEPLGAREITRLKEQLSSGDWILQDEALEVLGRHKIAAAREEIAALLDKASSSWARGRALVALSRISGADVFARAEAWSRGEDAELRRAAVQALGIIESKQAVESARRLLKDKDPAVRAEAAHLCAKHHPEEAWPVARDLSEHADPRLAVPVARALARLGSDEALQRLEALYEAVSKDEDRAYRVIESLRFADERAVPLLVRLVSRYRPAVRAGELGQRILSAMDRDKVSASLQAIFDSGTEEFYGTTALFAATVCPSEKLEDTIAATLRKDRANKESNLSPDSLRACLDALVTLEPARHTDLFNAFLDHPASEVRARAVRCRALCDQKDLFEVFRPRMKDPDAVTVRTAMDCLVRTPLGVAPGEGVAAYLKDPLSSANREVLLAAFNLLGRRGLPDEFETAMNYVRPYLEGGNDEYRRWAAETLARLGGHEHIGAIAAAQGYLSKWKIIGPFLNDRNNTGFKEVYPPEKEIDLAMKYKVEIVWDLGGGGRDKNAEPKFADIEWRDAEVAEHDGSFNVAMMMPPPAYFVVAYGISDIEVASKQTVHAVIEADNSYRLWLNGKMVSELDDTVTKRENNKPPPRVKVELPLEKGGNRVLLKVANRGGPWWFRIRLQDKDGKVFVAGR